MTGPDAPVFVPDPAVAARSQLASFLAEVAGTTGLPPDAQALTRWAAAEWRAFWGHFLAWAAPVVEGSAAPVCVGDAVETARFFPGLRLSYTENLLRSTGPADDDALAVVAQDETGHRVQWTRGELRARVEATARSLASLGVKPGDRVAAIARNDDAAIVACLAATGLGATWSSIGPDQGPESVLARFAQLQPTLLFTVGSHPYQGTLRPLRERLQAIVAGLSSVRTLVALDGDVAALEGLGACSGLGRVPMEPLVAGTGASSQPVENTNDRLLGCLPGGGPPDPQSEPDSALRYGLLAPPVHALADLEARGAAPERFSWPRLPFDHPLFVMFSSGTTGAPKCIVHGVGGTLLEHLKEQRLHSDFGPGDRLLFTTSCGWMMWNWQLSALASHTAVVAYDGSPTWPTPDALWRVVAENRATVFGTSPAFLQYCRDLGLVPREGHDLSHLRAMQSTGSVLADRLYDWVAENVGSLPLQSISGGTDVIGCLVLGNPLLPVWRGEAQGPSLGLDVRSLRAAGAADDAVGELVVANPFPSRPVCFFNDPDGARYHAAYFAANPGLWTHGDFVVLTRHGGARILGRSDGVMNIRGIRVGPAEIYAILQEFDEIQQAMALEQLADGEIGGTRLVLLVVLKPGVVLDRPLTLRLKKELSRRASMVHVPAAIVAVDELPVTHNGKLSERAARDAVNGREPANLVALKNPACLEPLRTHPELGGRFAG